MRELIFEIQSLLLNLFQIGFSNVSQDMIKDIQDLSQKCKNYNLTYVAQRLNELYTLLATTQENINHIKIADEVTHLSTCVTLLLKKIDYDDLGGY